MAPEISAARQAPSSPLTAASYSTTNNAGQQSATQKVRQAQREQQNATQRTARAQASAQDAQNKLRAAQAEERQAAERVSSARADYRRNTQSQRTKSTGNTIDVVA